MKDVIQSPYLEEYEEKMRDFYSQLFDLNVLLYLSEKIVEFPFHVFRMSPEEIFFNVVLEQFYNGTLLTITKLFTDQSQDFFTLALLNRRIQEIIKPEYSEAFRQRLRAMKFDKEQREILARTKDMRDFIAHNKRSLVTVSPPTLQELKGMRDKFHSILEKLSFGVEYIMLPDPYDDKVQYPSQEKRKPDIELILDGVVKESGMLDMAETEPEDWRYMREALTTDKLRIINQYRKKFGLAEV